jgi:Calcineurin-like phosphoesterase
MNVLRARLVAVGALTAGLLVQPRSLSLQGAEPACEFDRVERVVAVGDVHGAYDAFVGILRTAGLIDERQRWVGGKAHLVQTGDVVDRGPDSRKALDLLEKLQGDARKAGGAVHPLIGNHEAMRLLGDMRYVSPGEYGAFATGRSEQIRDDFIQSQDRAKREELLKQYPLGMLEMRVAFGRNGHYGELIRKLNVVVKINGIVFLHGGISPAVATMSCDAINTTVRRELATDIDKVRAEPLASLGAREDGPLWYRGLALEPDTFEPQVDDILAKQRARAIVVGHTVLQDGRIRARFGGKVIQIDTGMQTQYVVTGRASALEVKDGAFTAIYPDRRDVLANVPEDTPAAAPVPSR